MSQFSRVAGALLVLLLHAGSAHAVLIDRGGGLIYDTDLDVTWMQDAQYALTTGAASPGMSWQEASTWAADLEYYDSVRGTTLKDWRLPRTINLPSSSGFDTTGLSSELAYMYYVNLGFEANPTLDVSAPAPTSTRYNPFLNLAYLGYWSETEGQIPDRPWSWAMHFHFGWQVLNGQDDRLRVWVVRDGDVGSLVPGPEDPGLFLVGMMGLWFARRRREHASSERGGFDQSSPDSRECP